MTFGIGKEEQNFMHQMNLMKQFPTYLKNCNKTSPLNKLKEDMHETE